jgi:hypothetical protein
VNGNQLSGYVLLQHEVDDVDLCVVDWEQYVPDAIHCYELAVQVSRRSK